MRRASAPLLGIALGLVAFAGPTMEASAGVDRQMAGYTYHFFNDVDQVSVTSHFMRYDLQFDSSLAGAVQLNHETVVVPAVDAPLGSQEAADAITSASRPISNLDDAFSDFVKVRNELQGSLRYKRAEAGYYVSEESDYHAQMLWTNYNHDFLAKNLNLSAGLNYAWDRIEPLNDQDTAGIAGERETVYMSLVGTTVLTPSTVMRLGIERTLVDGLQHNPYRNVYAGGNNQAESHPFQRRRDDFFIRVSQFFENRSSVKLDYKYYSDDWGVDSHTAGVKLNQYVTDTFVVRYRYRYYSQGAAFFFRDEYLGASGIEGHLTGDYRLGDFDAHLFGGKIFWNLDSIFEGSEFIQRFDLSFGFERYFNSTNFTANIFETSLEMSF